MTKKSTPTSHLVSHVLPYFLKRCQEKDHFLLPSFAIISQLSFVIFKCPDFHLHSELSLATSHEICKSPLTPVLSALLD
jgi:hypothetical protein